MSGPEDATASGPDLGADGAALAEIPEGGILAGRFEGEGVVLVRKGGAVHALGATCTHYGGPLALGLFDGRCVRCPWHQAGFRPETGEAVHAPAIDPVASYAVERRGDRVFVTGRRTDRASRAPIASAPDSVVIVGGGAAGFAAAEMLRREGYDGPVSLLSEGESAPYDRPNLSKDYLAGTAQEEWMPLRATEWYRDSRIDLGLGKRVVRLAPTQRQVLLEDGRRLPYGALLLATGATPLRLDCPGADRPHVHTLRTMRDSRAIIATAERARRVVVVGSSFIGLEAAAALTTRGLEVRIVGRDDVPMQQVLGPEVGAFVRSLHERQGVRFHMGETVREIGEKTVTLGNGHRLEAELVVVGIGVRPNLRLAEQAGLRIDRGVLVDEYLRTGDQRIWAAGDIARWPDPSTGATMRVEHWVVAERQGQTAARNMLGRGEPYSAVPFFWSQHYDVRINYVGHALDWDDTVTAGSISDGDGMVAYRKSGRILAVASIGRDEASLRIAAAMEREDDDAIERALGETREAPPN